jgi:PAS domain S-box-containing protein
MKKIKGKNLNPNSAIKKSSSKTSESQTSLTEGKASSKLQSKRAANRPPQSETEIVSDITSRKGLEMALQESEEAFRILAEAVPQIVWATRADGWNIFFNKRWVEYTGLTLEESSGHGWNIPFHPDDKKRSWDAWQQATKHGATYSLEVRLRRADGVYRWWLVRGAPLLDTTGKIINWFGTCTDIDDLKQAELRQALSTEILGILNNPPSMDDAISKIITVLKRETGFDAIGIRLQRGDDFPYIAQDGFSKDFILAENTLAVRTEDGGVCVDKDGNVCLECTCGMVISGKTDPTNPIFTPSGSCWTNESCAKPDRPIEDKRLHPRDRCIHEGYHSVALIPLRTDKRIIGILQLNDHRPNQFTLELVSFLENMGALIGIAVGRKRAEDEMHKAKERADALNLELEAANKELEERVAVRTVDLSRTNEQLRQEVGERRRAEYRLRESEMQMERAQEIAHLGSWELDLVSNQLSWSDEVYRIFGLQPQEFGATYEAFLDRVHPDDRAAVDSAYSDSLREGRDSYEIEHRVVRKSDKEVRIVHEKCEHFRNDSGAIIRSIGMVHDITGRKKAEAVQGHLAAIIENAEDAIIGEDLNGIIQTWNMGAENIFGYTAEEIIGKHVSILAPSGRVDEIQDILARIKDGERITNLETARTRKDGTIIPLSLTVSAIKDISGRIIGASKIAHDITERKLAEEALRQSLQRENERAEQLAFSNKELESFIYSISHDLRAPLRHIFAFADILMKNLADKLDEKSKRYLSIIYAGTEKMSRLVDDLLNLSRISRQDINREEVNISEIATLTITELRDAHPGRNVQIDIKGGLTAIADSGLIEVVLSNLIGNAWKFTTKTEHASIEIGTIDRENKIVYYVRDNGVGFDTKYTGKMFWPFHRLHSEAEFEGTGIGLAIVDRIIRRHGGKVWAEGREGKGATIYFSLA